MGLVIHYLSIPAGRIADPRSNEAIRAYCKGLPDDSSYMVLKAL